MFRRLFWVVVIIGIFCVPVVFAETNANEEKKEENPVGDIVKAPLDVVGGTFSKLTDTFFDLGMIRVSGGRLESEVENVPWMKSTKSSDVISQEEIQGKASFSTAEVLSENEAVSYSDDLGQGLSGRVDLRGFGGEAKEALVLMDGLRAVEPFDNSVTWTLYPLEYLQSIEILPGGASPVYGEGALSGVIALKTKEPTDKWVVNTENAIGSYKLQRHFVEASGKTPVGIGLYAAARYADTDGYRQNSSFESTSTLLKADYHLTDLLAVQNSFYFADNETGIPGPLTLQEADQNRRQKDPDGQFGDRFNDRLVQDGLRIDYNAEPIGVEINDLIGYRLRDQDSIQSFGGAFPGTSLNNIGTETFSNVLQGSRAWEWHGVKDVYSAGFEWSIDDIHNPFRFEDKTFGPFESERSIDRRLWGAFMQDRLEFWQLILEGGFRYDKIDWDIYDLKTPILEKHKKADALSPQVSLSWAPDDKLTFFGGYSESFKAPDSNTLIFETPNIFSPNPNIDASVSRHTEAGVRVWPVEQIFVKAVYFHIETKKEILFNDITNTNENFDTLREGVELSSQVALSKEWKLFFGYAYTDSSFDNGVFAGKNIPMVPETRWSSGVAWQGPDGWSAAIQASAVMDRFALNDFNNRFPAEDYWTADLKIQKTIKNSELFFKIQNLFDEEYSSFVTSDGVSVVNVNPSPGFNVEGGVRFKFE